MKSIKSSGKKAEASEAGARRFELSGEAILNATHVPRVRDFSKGMRALNSVLLSVGF